MPFHAKPPKKKIKGPDDMAELVAEFARLNNHVSAAKETEKAAKAKAAENLNADLVVIIPDKKNTVSAEDYRAELLACAEAAAKENPDLASAEGKKSRNYPSGSVGWKKQRDTIVLKDEAKLTKLAKSIGGKIQKALASIIPWKSNENATAAAFIKSVKVAKNGAFEPEFDAGKLASLGPVVLSRAGYTIEQGKDEFEIKPVDSKVD